MRRVVYASSSRRQHSVWSHARRSVPAPCVRRASINTRSPIAAAPEGNTPAGSVDEQCLPCIVDVMIVPSGVGASHSKHVAGVVQGFRDNPALTVATHPMGTCLEGEWDVVMGAVKSATLKLHAAGIGRVTTTLKAGTRTDKPGYTMAYKMQRIQDRLHEQSGTDTVGTRAVEHKGPVDTMLRDKVAQQMTLSQVQAVAGLELNQTKAQLGDPTYDEHDEARWIGMARRAGNVEMSGVSNTEQDSSQQELFAMLLKAASNGDIALLESLLQQPEALTQVNVADGSPGGAHMTPLHWAGKNGHPDVCEALIQAGATVTACDQFGRTAIDLAQRYGHDTVVSMLIDASENH